MARIGAGGLKDAVERFHRDGPFSKAGKGASSPSGVTSPAMVYGGAASEDLLVEPISDALFGQLAIKLCAGATLVGFHRVLQSGMLPDQAVAAAAGSECAWRRFQAVARQRGIGLSRREPLTLNDCLEKLGLAPLETEDAALRALAIRALWRKLDGAE